jgi:hypothetical protein
MPKDLTVKVAVTFTQEEMRLAYERIQALEAALRATEAHLSLLRHRGGIRWGSLGLGDAYEYDAVIGEARRLLEAKD